MSVGLPVSESVCAACKVIVLLSAPVPPARAASRVADSRRMLAVRMRPNPHTPSNSVTRNMEMIAVSTKPCPRLFSLARTIFVSLTDEHDVLLRRQALAREVDEPIARVLRPGAVGDLQVRALEGRRAVDDDVGVLVEDQVADRK